MTTRADRRFSLLTRAAATLFLAGAAVGVWYDPRQSLTLTLAACVTMLLDDTVRLRRDVARLLDRAHEHGSDDDDDDREPQPPAADAARAKPLRDRRLPGAPADLGAAVPRHAPRHRAGGPAEPRRSVAGPAGAGPRAPAAPPRVDRRTGSPGGNELGDLG